VSMICKECGKGPLRVIKYIAVWVLGLAATIGIGVYAAFQLSPWPSVLLIRPSLDGSAFNAAISRFEPSGVSAKHGLRYKPDDRQALFDVYAPADVHTPLPAIVWVHGGGFIAGSRSDLSGYLQILASHGYVTLAIDYSLAPGARFPTPVQQVNAALAYIATHAERFGIDPRRMFLAGDSAGAQIAAQAALVISEPDYARRIQVTAGIPGASLRGLVLYCGPYDLPRLPPEGAYGDMTRIFVWAYVGTPNLRSAEVGQLSLPPHLTANYPPVFLSVGNADPLVSQSMAFAEAARAQGVQVDALFFPENHNPPLPHQYQFFLSDKAARLALERSLAFLAAHGGNKK
jgi:acetyl esterase/lipase